MTRSLIYRPVSVIRAKRDRVQGSGFRVQAGEVDRSPWTVDSAKPQTFSTDNSSFILHPSSLHLHPSSRIHRPSGYTLVEILLATVITLLLMAVVVQMFGALGQSITDSRSILEASERLRSAAARLQMDLQGVTVTMRPPRNPDDGEGYFEYIEGPVVQTANGPSGLPQPQNSELPGNPNDTSVGDFDDILLLTTRSTGRPFTGNFTLPGSNTQAVQSDVAEVAWFIRGRTLYRRQLLVSPGLPFPTSSQLARLMALNYYANNDISVRVQNGLIVSNTLSDLTRRECRYAHPTDEFPFDVRRWGQLGLPTLRESASWNLFNMVWPSLATKWNSRQPPLNHLLSQQL